MIMKAFDRGQPEPEDIDGDTPEANIARSVVRCPPFFFIQGLLLTHGLCRNSFASLVLRIAP